MARYGYVIRMGGDPEISGALRDGMEKGSSTRTSSVTACGRATFPDTKLVLQDKGEGNDTARRLAMMRHTPEEWRQMTEDARVIYGGQRYRPRWMERLLAGYALICYGLSRAYRAQDRVLVSRGYQRERRAM